MGGGFVVGNRCTIALRKGWEVAIVRLPLVLGYPEARVRAGLTRAAQPGRAPRHKNGIISVAKAQALLATPLLSAEGSIERAIRERLPG